MTRFIQRLRENERGSALVEFALGIPLFVTFVMGFWQVGLIYFANAGVHNALGEAARLATVWPVPSETDIEDMMRDHDFGTGNGTLDTVDATDNGDGTFTVEIAYSQPTDFIFFTGPTVTLNYEKLVYTAETTAAAEEESDDGSGTGGTGTGDGGTTPDNPPACWHPNPKKCQ